MDRRAFAKGLAAGGLGVGLQFDSLFRSDVPADLPDAVRRAPDRLEQLARDLSKATDGDSYWRRVRSEFQFDAGLVHLNTGSLGAAPRLVIDAVAAYAAEVEGNPVARTFGWGGARMEDVRALAARFLGADVDEVALTRNTTEAMNAVASGLVLDAGDTVLTTNHEHGGGMTCWQHARQTRGIRVEYVELPAVAPTEADILNRFESSLSPSTRVCSFSHVDTITGLVMPVAAIAELMRDRGIITVCDGAQAPGMLDVDVHALNVDAYACSAHKWLLGPKGSGLLYIREAARDSIRPAFLHSGYSAYSASGGTRGVDRVLGFGLAMEFHNVIARDRVIRRCRALRAYLENEFSTIEGSKGLTRLTPREPERAAGMVTYALPEDGLTAGELRSALAAEGIEIKSVQGTYAYCEDEGLRKQNYNAIRLSTHIFNSEADIDRLVSALQRNLL